MRARKSEKERERESLKPLFMSLAHGHAEPAPEDIEDQAHIAMRATRRRNGPPSLSSLVQSRSKAVLLASQALFVAVCFCILLRHGVRMSDERASTAPGLRQGWIGGRLVDLSDVQWRGFRGSIGPLAVVFGAFGGISRLLFGREHGHGTPSLAPSLAPGSLLHESAGRRVAFLVASSVGFLVYLHGRCAVYVYAIVSLSWLLTQWLKGAPMPSRLKTLLVWVWHVGVLMVVKGTDGFSSTLPFPAQNSIVSWLWGLDEALSGGLQRVLGRTFSRGVFRWEVCYNITMLRLISQSLDILWGAQAAQKTDTTDVQKTDTKLGRADRGGYWVAVAHALYPPLYLAGPIITYSDFEMQVMGPRDGAVESRAGATGAPVEERVTTYALRTALDMLAIELMSHFLYFNSIATNHLLTRRAATPVTPLDVATCGWWVLAFTWLKFCVIWRFFRLAALVEGIRPPENMRKCFAMNYDVQGFWKNWHASFNRWLVKYMYVPAGGSRYQMLVVWPIFIFVALWHDVEVRLLGWAVLMILAFMPELLVKRAFARPKWDWVRRRHPTALWVAKSLAATVTISSLMVGNMVGFVVGLDGMGAFLTQLLGSPKLVAASLVSFFSAASLMLTFEDWLYWAR